MNQGQIHETFKAVLSLLSDGKLSASVAKCRTLVDELQEGLYTDRLNDIHQNYQFLLDYYIKGVDDPQRKLVYNRLVSRLFVLTCELREELLVRVSSNFEYQQKRYFPHVRRLSTVDKLIDSLQYYHVNSQNEPVNARLRSNYELLLSDVFSLLWLNTSYNADELRLFQLVTSTTYKGRLERNLAITALTLNLWRMFDEDKLQLLLDGCVHPDVEVKQRSLVGLCFVLARYNRFIPYFPQIRNRLVLIADDTATSTNFRNILVQIIGTVETDKISKKLREEILPEIIKVSPLLKDKMEADKLLSSDEWGEANPEWQELLEKSGVQDKIQEFTDLQLEGADVYMGTFAMLKSFPFFTNFSNWFLPFDPEHSAVSRLFETSESSLLTAFVAHNALCNSDKYSFCLSVMQMPEAQQTMLKGNFKLETEQLAELSKDQAILTPEVYAKNISKQYVQDLFRFFKLHPQCKDFTDMFASALFMHRSYLFDILSSDSELKNQVAEFYFAKSQYREAIELFKELENEVEPTASLFQKLGYCYQQLSDVKLALESYLRADIIQPDNLWTNKKIALCYKLLGDFAQAQSFYRHADFLRPNQRNVKLQIAHCYLELGDFKQAIQLYLQLEQVNESDTKVLRSIVWCAFVSGNKAQARYYAQRLAELETLTADVLIAMYVELLDGKVSSAVVLLRQAIALENGDKHRIEVLIQTDLKRLKQLGVVLIDMNLLLDAVSM